MSAVGVVGAGVMGAGVAQALAEAGRDVVLVDIEPAQLERALADVRRGLAMSRLLRRDAPVRDPDEVVARIATATDLEALATAGFVIENATERLDVKRAIWPRLDAICPPAAILAANTSAVPIGMLAGMTGRPAQVLGMHFMNPAPLKPTVEVIRGAETSDETLAAAEALLASMGKEGIVVRDAPGFVSNRVLMLTLNEAARVVQEGTAPAEDVDRLFKTCFGHAMGPLETGDLIGWDTIADTLAVLRQTLGDERFQPCELVGAMVERGETGRKNGKGFYAYGAGR